MSQLQLLTKFTVMKTQMMIALHVHSVSQSLTPALAHAAQILKLLTSQRTCFNLKTREIYLQGTFRLLGTANINGLVCVHPLTRYSVIICCSTDKQGLLTSKSPFVHGGFSNWKKAIERLKSQEVLHTRKLSASYK